MKTNDILYDGKQKAVIFHLKSGTTIRVPCMSAEVRFDNNGILRGYTLNNTDGVILFLDLNEVAAVTIDWMVDETV